MNTTRIARPRRKVSANKLRQTLYWLTQDWIHLNSTLPVPTSAGGRTSNVRAYGHPAEWASDQCTKIADLFWNWHDLTADHRQETRPARRRREQDTIVNAWKYLEPRLDELLTAETPFAQLRVPYHWDWAIDDEAFDEIFDLHRHIRQRLGLTNPRTTLPIPCPNDECGLRTLMRVAGAGQDFIICDACGYTIKDQHYPLLIRMTIDTLISTS